MNLLTKNISPKNVFHPNILRIAKTARQKSRINAKAKSKQNQSQTVQTPYLKLKRKPGARKGNRNALKHGLYTAERAMLKLRVYQAIAELRLAAAQAKLEAAMMDAETASKLRAAGLASLRLPALPALAMG